MNQAKPKPVPDTLEGIRRRYIKCDKKLFDLQREYATMTFCVWNQFSNLALLRS